ncbi:transposase [Streptococcus suis]|nr:transposase [Streptococcus suis]
MPNVIKLTNLSHFVVGYFLCYTKNKRGKVMLDQIKAHLYSSKIKIIRCQLALN